MDNASILVAGGGGCALQVTKRLKDAGSWVWQLQRTDVRRCALDALFLCMPTLPRSLQACLPCCAALVCGCHATTALPCITHL